MSDRKCVRNGYICIYRRFASRHACKGRTMCHFLYDTGQKRGCPADENCNRYVPGRKYRKPKEKKTMRKAKTTIYFGRDGEVDRIVSSAGPTRNNKAAFFLHCNDVQPTFGMKLRRFFRCAYRAVKLQAAEIEREHRRDKSEAVICPALPERLYEDARS